MTWHEGSNPKLTGQGLSLWSSGSIRVPPVDPGSSQPSTTLGEVGAEESQWLRTDRSALISQLLCTTSSSDDKAAKSGRELQALLLQDRDVFLIPTPAMND